MTKSAESTSPISPAAPRNATDSGPIPPYSIRQCRGHWHVCVGSEQDDLITKPNALSYERALEICSRLNAGEELDDIEAPNPSPAAPLEFEEVLDELIAQIPTPSNPVTWLAGEEWIAAARSHLTAYVASLQEKEHENKADNLVACLRRELKDSGSRIRELEHDLDSARKWNDRLASSLAKVRVDPEFGELLSAIIQRVCELDYTPPEDFPENMVMLTTDELRQIVASEIEDARLKDHKTSPDFVARMDAFQRATEDVMRALRNAGFEHSSPEIDRATEQQSAARSRLTDYVASLQENALTLADAQAIVFDDLTDCPTRSERASAIIDKCVGIIEEADGALIDSSAPPPHRSRGYEMSIKPALTALKPDDPFAVITGYPHKIAATALYGQPFGFTQEDVRRLRNWEDDLHFATLAKSLADRIEALLPKPSP